VPADEKSKVLLKEKKEKGSEENGK